MFTQFMVFLAELDQDYEEDDVNAECYVHYYSPIKLTISNHLRILNLLLQLLHFLFLSFIIIQSPTFLLSHSISVSFSFLSCCISSFDLFCLGPISFSNLSLGILDRFLGSLCFCFENHSVSLELSCCKVYVHSLGAVFFYC